MSNNIDASWTKNTPIPATRSPRIEAIMTGKMRKILWLLDKDYLNIEEWRNIDRELRRIMNLKKRRIDKDDYTFIRLSDFIHTYWANTINAYLGTDALDEDQKVERLDQKNKKPLQKLAETFTIEHDDTYGIAWFIDKTTVDLLGITLEISPSIWISPNSRVFWNTAYILRRIMDELFTNYQKYGEDGFISVNPGKQDGEDCIIISFENKKKASIEWVHSTKQWRDIVAAYLRLIWWAISIEKRADYYSATLYIPLSRIVSREEKENDIPTSLGDWAPSVP